MSELNNKIKDTCKLINFEKKLLTTNHNISLTNFINKVPVIHTTPNTSKSFFTESLTVIDDKQ